MLFFFAMYPYDSELKYAEFLYLTIMFKLSRVTKTTLPARFITRRMLSKNWTQCRERNQSINYFPTVTMSTAQTTNTVLSAKLAETVFPFLPTGENSVQWIRVRPIVSDCRCRLWLTGPSESSILLHQRSGMDAFPNLFTDNSALAGPNRWRTILPRTRFSRSSTVATSQSQSEVRSMGWRTRNRPDYLRSRKLKIPGADVFIK